MGYPKTSGEEILPYKLDEYKGRDVHFYLYAIDREEEDFKWFFTLGCHCNDNTLEQFRWLKEEAGEDWEGFYCYIFKGKVLGRDENLKVTIVKPIQIVEKLFLT